MKKEPFEKKRLASGVLLLSLLAISGYMSTGKIETKTVSTSVSRVQYEPVTDSAEYAKTQLKQERNKEIEMLNDIVNSEAADDSLKQDALKQLSALAERIEIELQTQECLEKLGISASVTQGKQGIIVICPADSVKTEEARLRILDAVCSVNGCEEENIKIILTKK